MMHCTTDDGEKHAQIGETQQPRATQVPQLPTEEERLQPELGTSAISVLVRDMSALQK